MLRQTLLLCCIVSFGVVIVGETTAHASCLPNPPANEAQGQPCTESQLVLAWSETPQPITLTTGFSDLEIAQSSAIIWSFVTITGTWIPTSGCGHTDGVCSGSFRSDQLGPGAYWSLVRATRFEGSIAKRTATFYFRMETRWNQLEMTRLELDGSPSDEIAAGAYLVLGSADPDALTDCVPNRQIRATTDPEGIECIEMVVGLERSSATGERAHLEAYVPANSGPWTVYYQSVSQGAAMNAGTKVRNPYRRYTTPSTSVGLELARLEVAPLPPPSASLTLAVADTELHPGESTTATLTVRAEGGSGAMVTRWQTDWFLALPECTARFSRDHLVCDRDAPASSRAPLSVEFPPEGSGGYALNPGESRQITLALNSTDNSHEGLLVASVLYQVLGSRPTGVTVLSNEIPVSLSYDNPRGVVPQPSAQAQIVVKKIVVGQPSSASFAFSLTGPATDTRFELGADETRTEGVVASGTFVIAEMQPEGFAAEAAPLCEVTGADGTVNIVATTGRVQVTFTGSPPGVVLTCTFASKPGVSTEPTPEPEPEPESEPGCGGGEGSLSGLLVLLLSAAIWHSARQKTLKMTRL